MTPKHDECPKGVIETMGDFVGREKKPQRSLWLGYFRPWGVIRRDAESSRWSVVSVQAGRKAQPRNLSGVRIINLVSDYRTQRGRMCSDYRKMEKGVRTHLLFLELVHLWNELTLSVAHLLQQLFQLQLLHSKQVKNWCVKALRWWEVGGGGEEGHAGLIRQEYGTTSQAVVAGVQTSALGVSVESRIVLPFCRTRWTKVVNTNSAKHEHKKQYLK